MRAIRNWTAGWALLLWAGTLAAGAAPPELIRPPSGGLQPQAAVDATGVLHLLYFAGEPGGGDLFYLRRAPGAGAFSAPVPVNSRPRSAIAIGTIRGGHLAVGQRVHVAWMGVGTEVSQMCYARSESLGQSFEPQRDLIHTAFGLDGGGSLAADGAGQVYVSWHAGQEGEEKRRVWMARSTDEGQTFTAETRANPIETGACGCCGMRAAAGPEGTLDLLYRAATGKVHRDMHLLVSADQGRSFSDLPVHPWELNACPMSSAALTPLPGGQTLLAWETAGQVYWARADQRRGTLSAPVPAPGPERDRKHPAIAINPAGQMLLVWTEGTGWNQGGALAWQLYEADGQPAAAPGRLPQAIPVWSNAAVVARPDGGFAIIY
ncbi:MAG: exo-alpha-sialidase [Candidatus Latescibacteria bacterium]|nr:exo-alpha-sialidase [Candidatus Latescibacterota bacterium]